MEHRELDFMNTKEINPKTETMRAVIVSHILFSLVIFAGGCATIFNKSDQDIAFSSDPPGVTVRVNGIPKGKTPVTIPIPRSTSKPTIRFELAGYEPAEITLARTMSGTTAGNLILGGIIGVAFDAMTGKGYSYKDDHLHVELTLLPQTKSPAD